MCCTLSLAENMSFHCNQWKYMYFDNSLVQCLYALLNFSNICGLICGMKPKLSHDLCEWRKPRRLTEKIPDRSNIILKEIHVVKSSQEIDDKFYVNRITNMEVMTFRNFKFFRKHSLTSPYEHSNE